MKKFLITYYSPAAAMEKMANATPEEKEAGMKPWMAWMEKCAPNLVDGGAPLMPGSITTGDGNFSFNATEVSGYSIMQADSMETIQALCADHPHTQWLPGCKLEIQECVPMG